MVELFANSGDPDATFLAAVLGLHCLPDTCLGVSNLQWANTRESTLKCLVYESFWMMMISSLTKHQQSLESKYINLVL